MKPEGPAKHFILAFLLALGGYIVCYKVIEHRRVQNGPWRVRFTTDRKALPTIVIDQPRLGITNVQICFTGVTLPATNSPVTLDFGQPKPVPYAVPFGQCVFMDTTFLPGTVTFQLFGHEIELLPRVLVIDRQEHPWRPETTIVLLRSSGSPRPASAQDQALKASRVMSPVPPSCWRQAAAPRRQARMRS